MIIFIIIIALVFCYLLWALMVYLGWQNFINAPVNRAHAEAHFSVIIPFRNEAEKLPALLASILALKYSASKVEIIFVDDQSEDDSATLVTDWMAKSAMNAQLISSAEGGKKAAQYAGVLHAKHQYIACTDADCELPENWLMQLNEEFWQRDVVLIFGGVVLTGAGQHLQKLEFLSLIGSTMAMLMNGWPVMGNGANMAFDKAVFLSVFPALNQRNSPSGDDVFLLHEVAKKHKVGTLRGADVIVKTPAQPSLRAFISQRMRWASKAKGYHSRPAIFVALLVFVMNTALLLMAIGACFAPALWSNFAVLFALKSMADFILLKQFSAFYKQPFTIIHFLLQEIINLIYIPFIAIFSQLVSYRWKGRKY